MRKWESEPARASFEQPPGLERLTTVGPRGAAHIYRERIEAASWKAGRITARYGTSDELVTLAFDRVDSLSIAFEGIHSQAHPLAQLPADEPAYTVSLPSSYPHDGLEAGSRRLSE